MSQPKVPTATEFDALEAVDILMAQVRKAPGEFRTVAAMAGALDWDLATLDQAFRLHLHRDAASFLEESRVDAACKMLLGHFGPPLQTGDALGFASHPAFAAQFHRRTGLTPGRYQALGLEGSGFTVDLPPDYRIEDVLAYHGRDPLSLTEQVAAGVLRKAAQVQGQPVILELALKDRSARVKVRGDAPVTPRLMGAVHRKVVRMLGLCLDPAPFEQSLSARPDFQALVAPRLGLRIPLTADVWESLVWAILGQQVNLAFAYSLRRKLTELCGGAPVAGLRAHPGPRDVAALEPEALTRQQFSRSKAEYLILAAQAVADGELPLEALPAGTATAAAAQLSARRGIGPWTTHYVMMRGCGFGDCVPLGDSGLTAALQRHLDLDHRPGAKETAELMAPFAPHRSLATFHLWASLKGVPA